MVQTHFRFVESPSNYKSGVLVPMVWPLDGFQGPSDFHGHSNWFLCEVALSLLNCQESIHFPFQKSVCTIIKQQRTQVDLRRP